MNLIHNVLFNFNWLLRSSILSIYKQALKLYKIKQLDTCILRNIIHDNLCPTWKPNILYHIGCMYLFVQFYVNLNVYLYISEVRRHEC